MCRWIVVFIVLWHILPVLSAQDSSRLPGQFIIYARDDRQMNAFLSNRVENRSQGMPAIRQIMKQPFSLWLVEGCQDNEDAWRREFEAFSGFEAVYPNRRITSRILPDDPDVGRQWQYVNPGGTGGMTNADMDMDQAWDLTTGGLTPSGDTIVICIIDDGINGTHEDMRSNLWVNHNEIPGNGQDDDGNGYVDDIRGWNITTDSDDVYLEGGHGTPVAGIAGARGNNQLGVSGVNWNVKLMIVDYGTPTEANALAAYGYAYTMRTLYNRTAGKRGAFVVATNASWGIDKATAEDAPLWCALYDSLGMAGIVNCAATTNRDTDVDAEGDLPTSCQSDFLVTVTNMDRLDKKVTNAGYGTRSIDLGAYGQQVYTVTRTGYGAFSGTSAASPHVAGLIGLLYSLPCNRLDSIAHQKPDLAARMAKDALLDGVKQNTSLQQITTSQGVLNAYRCLTLVTSLCDTCPRALGVGLIPADQGFQVVPPPVMPPKMAVRYRESGTLDWVVQSVDRAGLTVGNLAVCTEFEIQTGSSCGNEEIRYGYSRYLTTTGCCTVPQIQQLASDSSGIRMSIVARPDANITLYYTQGDAPERDTSLQGRDVIFTGLPLCQAWSFRLVANCTTYANQSDTSKVYTASTPCGNCTSLPYCVIPQKDDSQEWIASFTLAGSTTESSSSGIGYTNHAGASSIELVPGNNYPFSLRIGYASTPFPDFFAIYMDLNQDGIFQPEDRLYKTPAPITEGIHGVITVPDSVAQGYTRLRLLLSYEELSTACDGDNFTYGEVEDYCAYISGRSCPFDAGIKLISSEKDALRFSLQWKNNTPDTVVTRYRKSGMTEWKEQIFTDSIRLSGLTECTLYEVEFRSFCGMILSVPSPRDTFRTACLNQVADNIGRTGVWPNPVYDVLHMAVAESFEPVQAIVKDALGRQVKRTVHRLSPEEITVDVRGLVPGMYQLVLLSRDGGVQSVAWIKTD